MTAQFELRCLGGLAVSAASNGQPLLVNQRKRLTLLAVLAADRREFISRDWLLTLFWPESDEERARNSLNQLVFGIRRELGNEALVGDLSALRLDPTVVDCDVRRFRTAMSASCHAEALASYGGPFLDGVFLRDVPEFERWVEGERRALAELHGNALQRVTDEAMASGRHADAVRYARLLAAHDPLSTQGALQLMRALALSGDTPAALGHAALHSLRMRAELESPPDPVIEREAERLRSNAASPAPASLAELPAVVPSAVSVQTSAAPAARHLGKSRFRALIPLMLVILFVSTASPAARSRWRNDVVVLPFALSSTDTGLTTLAELISREALRSLERSQRVTVVQDLSVRPQDGVVDPDEGCTLRVFSMRCRAGFAVSGSIRRVADSVGVFTTVLVRGASASRRDLPVVMRPQAEAHRLMVDAAEVIGGAISALSDPRVPELAGAAQLPRYGALLEYDHAAQLLVDGKDDESIQHLHTAAELDSGFAAPRLLLSELDEGASRDSAANWLEVHRARLSARDRLLAEAIDDAHRGLFADWFGAASRLRQLAPEDASALRQYAKAAFATNFYASADSSYRTLRRLPGWMAEFPYEEISSLHAMGDFDTALQRWKEIRERRPDDPSVCVIGVMQFAAAGRVAETDSLIARCGTVRDIPGNLNRLGRAVSIQDELYRRAGREFLWHGYASAGQRALAKAFALERRLFREDTSANNGWLAMDLSRNWPEAYRLMREDFASQYPLERACARRDARRACIPRNRLRFAVTAAHVGDTTAAMETLRWLDQQPHPDSLYKVERAKILLALNRRAQAVRSLRDALSGTVPATWMHANTELLDLRGDPGFEALVAPRVVKAQISAP